MHIYCLGLNHNTTPIELREQFSLSEEAIRSALARLAWGHLSASIAELVILSTCNRTELYAVSSQPAFAELENFLSDVCSVPVNDFRPHLYRYRDVDAARHLFHVAAGLDSLVIGEPQILGQIVRALELARGQTMAGPVLNRLFQSAIHAGKRARTETAISRNPASVSSLAASLAERVVHPISEAQVVVIGAGEMAELAVEALRKRGAQKILVINRTLERACTLAKRWGAQAATFENLNDALLSADILLSSTSAPHLILTSDMVLAAMTARPHRPLVLIDIAIPRDIDPDAARILHIQLYDMDRLNAQLEDSLAERLAEAPKVRAILEEELAEFSAYLQALAMLPLIADIRQRAETIRREMLEKTLRRLPDLTEAERVRIEAMTQALVKQILHAPPPIVCALKRPVHMRPNMPPSPAPCLVCRMMMCVASLASRAGSSQKSKVKVRIRPFTCNLQPPLPTDRLSDYQTPDYETNLRHPPLRPRPLANAVGHQRAEKDSSASRMRRKNHHHAGRQNSRQAPARNRR